MCKIEKKYFSQYAEFECERQLILNLAEENKSIIDENYQIKPTKRYMRSTQFSLKIGKEYEQSVYQEISKLPNSKATISENDNIIKTNLTKEILNLIHDELLDSDLKQFCLLEYEIETPNLFLESFFDKKIKIDLSASAIRPDILILNKEIYQEDENKIYEILPNGLLKALKTKSDFERIGINIFDIKSTNQMMVNKKQFIEIVYYGIILSSFLYEKNLNAKFFVRANGNGIIPNIPYLSILNIKDFKNQTIQFSWDSCFRLFKEIIERINSNFIDTPIDVSKDILDINISPSCGRCRYIEDCKKLLGYYDLSPKEWDIRLLPNLSKAVAEQLRGMDIRTIGNAYRDLNELEIGNTPSPIYPRLPLMKIKLDATNNNKTVFPKQDEIYSLAIPKYSDFVLLIDNEYDPIRDRVYAVGIHLHLSVRPKKFGCFKDKFDFWWQIWYKYLQDSISLDEIKVRLDSYLKQEISEKDIKTFARIIDELWREDDSTAIDLILPNSDKDYTTINYWFNLINQGISDLDEANLTKNTLKTLHILVTFCNIMEKHLSSEPDERGYVQKPNLAIYYWSTDQLTILEELIERNLQYVIMDDKVKPLLLELSTLFSPSESSVKDPFQHKKLFDLRVFAETVVGLPNCVINYTWHETAKELLGTNSNIMFWLPHFNYMDYVAWDEFLAEEDPKRKQELDSEICRQIRHKLRTINSLRVYFQSKAGKLVSRNTIPIESKKIMTRKTRSDFHALANFWYVYSKLNGTISEYEADYFRTMYPLFSIAKLQSAKALHLKSTEIPTARSKKYSYEFELHDLSTNIKLSEGDHVLLMPIELRDSLYPTNWKVIIDQMNWKKKPSGETSFYEIRTTADYGNLIEKAQEILDCVPKKWYLYPHARDNWSGKLWDPRKNTGLLNCCNFGISWLGQSLAFLWNICLEGELDYPLKSTFNTPELYLYAPQTLQKKTKLTPMNLLTEVKNKPDTSQELAIRTVLENTVSMIIGPPGTGKTETIISLIDEYLLRNKDRNVKILISAFSYAALNVVLDKLQKSVDKNNNETLAATIQKIFLRSQSYKPKEFINSDDNILDMHRSGSSWKVNNQSYKRMKRSSRSIINESFILLGNAHQLNSLSALNEYASTKNFPVDFSDFDFIIVDEASQYPTDYFMSCLQYVRNYNLSFVDKHGIPIGKSREDPVKIALNMVPETQLEENCLTKIVIVGDHNQLPPVRAIKPPQKLDIVLSSLFNYYYLGHNIEPIQLENNYRSNQAIVEYTSSLGLYKNLKAHENNASSKIIGDVNKINVGWVKEVLDPDKIVCSLIHDKKYDMTISMLEAKIVVKLILGYYAMSNPETESEQKQFWEEEIGIVAPHNAQGRMIINTIFEELIKNKQIKLNETELMNSLKKAIVSVEKFQGSDRKIIIASMGISDRDQLGAEEEFIFDLNRFNVLTSRAKSKAILVCSKNYLDYLPKNHQIMDNASKIREFTYYLCDKSQELRFSDESIVFRWKEN